MVSKGGPWVDWVASSDWMDAETRWRGYRRRRWGSTILESLLPRRQQYSKDQPDDVPRWTVSQSMIDKQLEQ